MTSQPRIVILNPTCLDVLDAHRAYLDDQDVEWVAEPSFRFLDASDVENALAGAHALVLPSSIRRLPSSEQMERHTSLRVLAIAATGYDFVDVEAATRCGIVITYAPVREAGEVVADLAWGLILSIAREIPHYHAEILEGRLDRGMGVSVWGKTLGIVGLGNIGQKVARRAQGFDMRILATDPKPDTKAVEQLGIEMVTLDDLLEQSDFVSLHVRLNQETREMISQSEFTRMKRSAFLINTARRELVDEDALSRAVSDCQIAGAALDDPPRNPQSPLLGLPNVIFTPHLGNRAIEGVDAVFRSAIDSAIVALAGQRPDYVVNPQVYNGSLRTA